MNHRLVYIMIHDSQYLNNRLSTRRDVILRMQDHRRGRKEGRKEGNRNQQIRVPNAAAAAANESRPEREGERGGD